MSASSSFSLMEPAEEPDANDVAIFDSAKEAAGGGDAGGQTIEQMYASTLGLEIDKARAKASIETAEAFWTAALADAHRVTSTPLLPSDGGMRSDGDAQGLEGIGRAGGRGYAAASHESEESVPKMHLLSYASGSHVGDRDAGVVAMGPYSPSPARSATTSSPSSSSSSSSSLASPRTPLSPPPPPPPTPQRQLLSKLTAEEDGAIAAAVESVVWQDDVRNRLMRRACGLDAEKQGVVFEHQRWTMLSGWRQTVPKSPSSSSSSLKTTTSASSAAAAARPKVPNGDPHPWAIGGRYRDEQQPHAALMEIAPSSSSTATTTTTTFPASMPTLTRIGPHETLWSAVVDQRFTDTSGWVYGTDWNRMLLLSEAALGGGNLGGKSGGGGAVGWLQRHATHRGITYREGGRAAARATDRVRRRMWLRHIEERDSQGVLAEPTASATGDERRAKGNDDNGQDDDRGKVTGDEEQADGMSASSALAPPSEVARAVLFDVLGRMARRRNLGFWSASTTLLDGTAWWRTVRRDVRDYAAWLRGPCGRINAALKLRAARQRLLMRRCWKGREGGSSSLGRGSDGTESPQVLEDISLGDTPSEGDLSSGNDDENDGGENNAEQNDDDDDDDELFDAIMAGTATSSHEAAAAAAVNAESVESQARLEVLARAGECLVVPSSRLRLACAGALHACASYGYPMAKGWLSSVRAGATLLTWRRMTGVLNRVDAVRGVDGSSHDAAARAIVGQQFEILAANWTSSTFCPVWYVGADHALGWAVVSVRGTLNRTDIWTDLAVDAVPFSGGHVHRGVLEATNKVLTAIIKPLEAARLAYPSYRVVCCGHSLGGCIAAVLASMLRVTDVGRGAVCVAIGPMPCLSADVQVETAPPSQQMRSRAPRTMSESELVGREGINDNGGGDQTLKNKGDDEEDRNDDDDDYDNEDDDDDDEDEDDDEGDAAFSIERYMKASFGDGFDTRKANETLTTEAVAAAPPAPNVVKSEEEDSCSRGELENESGDSQDESGEVADDDSLDMKSQGDEEVFEACVGFEAFTTSVILGMDPAPRMSVACLERLLDDLARSTMASVTTAAFGSMGASVVGTLRGMSLPRIRGESNVGGETRSMAGAPSNGNGDGDLKVAAPTAGSDTLRSVANDVHASAASESNATREEPPEDPVLLPPGTLIHLDDDSQGLLSSPKAEKASTATRPMHSNDEREKKNAGSSGAKNTGSNTSGDAKRHVAAFYSDASHYRRLYLSFSLMSYHVPQRYLGALIAAVNEQRRLFPEGSKNPRSDDVTVAQFAVRFEHVGV